MSTNLAKNHWTKQAACKFDKKFLSFHIDAVNEAKEICESCEVQVECIIWTEEIDGCFISAGTSKYDRLLIQWNRVENIDETNFRGSDRYVRKILQRVRQTIRSGRKA